MTYSYPVGATLPRASRSFSPAPVPIKAEGTYDTEAKQMLLLQIMYCFPRYFTFILSLSFFHLLATALVATSHLFYMRTLLFLQTQAEKLKPTIA